MIPNTLESYLIDDDINGKILEQTEILRQITQVLKSFHSEGKVYGELTPSDVTLDAEKRKLLPNKRTNILANKSLAEWRPAEERINSNSDWKPTIQGDIFNLGCFFYYIITGGQHPFGSSGQRISFIANNLYDLSGCRDELLQKLIRRMISYDSAKRPSCSELFRHPYLWERAEIEEYMYVIAEHIDEANNQHLKLKDHFLLSTSQPSTVKSVSDILVEIKNRQENPLNACNMFPDFLSTVILVYDSDGEIQKEINDESSRPIIFKNLLIANDSFGVVGPFKKRHGRFGLQPIHVMEFPQTSTDLYEDSSSSMKRLACSSHPNILKYFSVSEYSKKISSERFIILACEPFDDTLETFMVRKKNSLDFETKKEIFNQITAGLLEYHSINLVHGNITSSQIAISNSNEKIIAKISKFPIYDKTERPAASMQNDIRRLGRIFLDLFDEQVKVTPPLYHLIRAMTDIRDDECVPSCEAVFYHPFFWSVEEIADFLIVAMDFYKDNPNIDRTSTIVQSINSKQEFQHLKTNRSVFEYFQSQTTSDSFTEEATIALAVELTKNYPMLVIQTWLKLQKYKSMDFGMELEPFYCPTYDFPIYDELRDERKHTLEGIGGSNVDPRVDQKDNPEKRVCKELVPISRQEEEDEGYHSVPRKSPHSGSDFIIDQFSISNPTEPPERQLNKWSAEVSSDANYPIQRYLSNYVRQWEIAQEDDPNSIMNHPVIDPFGRTAMHLACHSDDFYDLAVKLFELGFSNPDVIDKNGYAPLHVAAETRAIKITELLIEMKATIDICGKDSITPLFFAVMSNSPPTIQLLMKNKADVSRLDGFGRNPLHYAVATNSIQNVDLLLKNVKSNQKSLHEIVNTVDQDGMSPLHIAVANKSFDMVNYLLRNYSANPNVAGKLDGTKSNVQQLEKKRPVLQFAVALQLYDVIDLLLQEGADPNMTDFQGQTALHIAALMRPPNPESLKIVDRLIKNKDNKANVNAVDHMGRTVLYAATFNEAEDIVKRLLECQPHIEVDKKEKDREITPLHLAAWKNSKNITEMLINQGKARVDVRDKNGDTPLEYAASSNAIDVAELLLQAMTSMAKTKRWKKRSPLHVAAAHNALQVGELLISKDADINAGDDLELTPLHYANFHGHDKFVELLRMKDYVSFTADPPVSKPLTPDELRSVHQLTNGFRLQNPSTIQIDLILPSIAQFNSFKLKITQELIIDGFQSNFR